MELIGILFIIFAMILAVMTVRGLRSYHRRTGRINISGAVFAVGSIVLWMAAGIYILLS